MKFFTAAAFFAAAAVAAPMAQEECVNPAHCPGTPLPDPNSYENVDVSDFNYRKGANSVDFISFKISGKDAKDLECTARDITSLPNPIVDCGEGSNYRFALGLGDISKYDGNITLYHQTGQVSGLWAQGKVPNYCHAGGNGPDDFVCNQVGYYTIVLAQSG